MGVSKSTGVQTHILPTDLTLQNGTMNLLLVQTSSGKTPLIRLMVGLNTPNIGQIILGRRRHHRTVHTGR